MQRSLSLPPGKKPGVKIEAVKSEEKHKIKKAAPTRAATIAQYTAPAIVQRMDKKAVCEARLFAHTNCLHFYLTFSVYLLYNFTHLAKGRVILSFLFGSDKNLLQKNGEELWVANRNSSCFFVFNEF